MKNYKRRVFTALMLLVFLITALQNPAFAINDKAQQHLYGMGVEAMKWYRLLLAIIIPLFIVRLASYGFMILGASFLSKGEFQMDAIKKDIMYTVLAIFGAVFFPFLLTWAKGLMKSNAWKPHVLTNIITSGGALW